MIWFLVALALFVLIGSIIDFSCNGWNISKQFFTDSGWGIVAVLAGILSLLLFYASSKSYKDVKINETFLPNPRRIKNKKEELEMSYEEQNLQIPEFDLSKITMETFVQKMAYEMTKPGPVFFKGWGNRRLELDVERVRILGAYIESIRSTGESLMQLNADAVLSYENIEKLTKIKRNELDEKVRRSELNLDFVNNEYKDKIKKMELENAEKEANIRLINAQAEELEVKSITKKIKAQALYKLMVAESKKEKEIANILSKGADSFGDLPPVLKSYVLAQLGSDDSPNPSTDMDLHEQLKEFVVRKQKAEARKLEYEADDVKEQSETLKAKLKREREKYKNNGKL